MTSLPKRLVSKRLAVPVACTGLAVFMLPWGGTAQAESIAPYSGYTSFATASPLVIEIYEPTIPIPHTPEFEMQFAYSKVVADSSSTKSRASFVWPGDPVGEGLKTFIEQLGLPPSLGKAGYPVQVNSGFPSGPARQSQEPLPGGFMKSSAEDGKAAASTGFSPDGDVQDPDGEDQTAAQDAVDLLLKFGQAISGTQTTEAGEEDPAPAATPGLPAPLSALVDMNGYVSSSKSENSGDKVTATARSALGEVSLLGGIVTMSGLQTRAIASSDGADGKGTGTSSYGVMTIVGKKFRMGPDGFEAGTGAAQQIPGLPDAPLKALETLGIKLTFPKPKYEVEGDKVVSTLAALEIQFDMKPLTKLLNTPKINDILGPILKPITEKFPPEAAPLTSLLGALGNLAPRFVVTLASAKTSADTVQPIKIPPVDPGESTVPGSSGNPGAGTGGTVPGGGAPVVDSPPVETPVATTPDLVSTTPGLPELFSIPGLLLVGAIAGASFLGTYLRKIGMAVLGTGGACPQGLDAGLPDLRKVM